MRKSLAGMILLTALENLNIEIVDADAREEWAEAAEELMYFVSKAFVMGGDDKAVNGVIIKTRG